VTPTPTEPAKGHPPGLYLLFFAEMWERFCFYGMRALLVLYMTKAFLLSDEQAYSTYGSYNALVYCTPIIGGLLADKVLGYRYAVTLGGLLMALGEFTLLVQDKTFFHLGMAALIVGNGFFKPNISTMVGRLYPDGDPRRDAGFSIFYMGINLGAFLAPLACGYVGETYGWNYGFGLAGLGMLLGLAVFTLGRGAIAGIGDPPEPSTFARNFALVSGAALLAIPLVAFLLQNATVVGFLLLGTGIVVLGSLLGTAMRLDKVPREKMFVILVLIFFHMTFWAFFEQAGSSLTLFLDRNVDRELFGWTFPTTWGQSFNPIFIVALAPVFGLMWVRLDKVGLNPSIPLKFVLGIIGVGAGFGVLVVSAAVAGPDGLSPLTLLVLCYLLHTMGELAISPVGLSMVTKLAPPSIGGLVMGAWFLSIAFAHYIAALLASLAGGGGGHGGGEAAVPATPAESLATFASVFGQIGVMAGIAAVLLLILTPVLKSWLHGVK